MFYKITTKSAPIKTHPSTNGTIIIRLSIDTILDIIDIKNKWASFIHENNTCYISTMYIKEIKDIELKEDNINDVIVDNSKDNLHQDNIVEKTHKNIQYEIKETDNKDKNLPTLKEAISKSITVKYIDTNSKQNLLSPVIYSNLQLGTYIYAGRDIFGYNSLNNTTQEVILTQDSENVEIIFEYEKILGKVTIQYIDTYDETEVSPKVIYENLDLNTYLFYPKHVPTYTQIETSYYEINLDKCNYERNLSFYYKKELGEITVRYLDIVTREDIISPDVLKGLGFDSYTYSAKEIPNYTIVGDTNKSITLDQLLNVCEIYFEYTLTN